MSPRINPTFDLAPVSPHYAGKFLILGGGIKISWHSVREAHGISPKSSFSAAAEI